MQESNFIHITAGIAQVIEAEEKLLSSLPVEVITQRRNAQNRTIKQILGHLIRHPTIINAWFGCNIAKTYFSSLITHRIITCG